MLSQLASFARTVLSPPTRPPKRAAFFEEDGSLAKRASYHAEDLAPLTPLYGSPVVGTPNSAHVPAISPLNESPLPFELPALSFSPASARRKRRLSGPLEEHKQKEQREAYRAVVEMNADKSIAISQSTDLPGSADVSSDVSSLHLNTSVLTLTPFYRHFPVAPETSVQPDRIRGVQEFLELEGERAIQNITLGAKQQTEHASTLKKLATEEYAHRSKTDIARAQRRRSVAHGSYVAEQAEQPPKVPVTSATTDHFLSPRAPSAARLEVESKNLDAKSTLVADSVRLTEKLEMLRKARERTDQEEITKRVDARVAAQRAKMKEEEPADLKPLSAEESAKVDKAISSGDDVVLSSAFNIEIRGRDIKTLAPTEWLNDEVINFYLQLLKEREQQRLSSQPLPKCHFFNTFFYAKLVNHGKYDYQSVRRWTSRGPIDIFALDKVIIPIHLPVHWCLAVINMKEKRFEYYDSLGGSNSECLKAMRRYLVDEFADKKKGQFMLDGWTDYTPRNIPQQMNGYDCGVFCVKFADYCARDQAFMFTQKEMDLIRRRLVLNLLAKKAE